MADIVKLNLPAASGVDFSGSQIDYFIATDPVHFDTDNRPLKNLAFRDKTIADKVDSVIDVVNAARGSVADLDTRLDVSLNEDGTVKDGAIPDVSALTTVAAGNVDARADHLRVQAASGFLSPHTDFEGGIGYVVETADQKDATGNRAGQKSSIYVRALANLVAGDANKLHLGSDSPLKVNVNGYEIYLEGQPSKISPMTVALPAAPSTGTRQDLAILEVWKEEIEVGSADDVLFPFGNVKFAESGTFDLCTLANTDHSGGNWPLYLATAAEHGYYVMSNDANIATFIRDPRNNVGVTADGKYFQIRYRMAVLPAVNAGELGLTNSLKSGSNFFVPQGQKATRPAIAGSTNSNGIFTPQVGTYKYLSTILDSGMFLGGLYTDDNTSILPVSGLSFDGVVYAVPVCAVHRRNSTAWALNNSNGAGAIGATSGRPDGKFYDQVSKDDILDLRHRVFSGGVSDYEALYEESLQQLLKSDLTTNWEELKEDPDGNASYDSLGIWGTKLLRAEGVAVSSFDSSWDICRIATCNNGISANPDGLRNYYSDVEGEQCILGRIPNENVDGVTPTGIFSYTAAAHSLALDATNMDANDGSHSSRPQFSGRLPDLYWSGASPTAGQGVDSAAIGSSDRMGVGVPVEFSFSSLVGDTLTLTIPAASYCVMATNADLSTCDPTSQYTNSVSGVVCIFDHISHASTAASFSYTGTTLPGSTGTWNKTAGPGPASFILNASAIFYDRKYTANGQYYNNMTFCGQGYDLHDGQAIFINAYVQFKAGSGFLTRVPYDNGDAYDGLSSIKASQFYIGGTQSVPNNGVGFVPFGSSPDVTILGLIADTHTKSTGLTGFMSKTSAIQAGVLGADDAKGWYGNSVIYDASEPTYKYKLWGYAISATWVAKIAYAESTDGITWVNHQLCYKTGSVNPGLIGAEGTYDTNAVSAPCVLKDGATYKMWYAADSGGPTRIMYATSTNGKTDWTGFTMVIDVGSVPGGWANDHLSAPKVIQESSSSYKILFSERTSSDNWTTGYADSTNGTTWSNHQMVLNGTFPVNTSLSRYSVCYFFKDAGIYKVFLNGNNNTLPSMHYATSIDGKVWSRPINVFSGRFPQTNPTTYVADLVVIKLDKAYKFWATIIESVSVWTAQVYNGMFTMVDNTHSGSAGSLSRVYGGDGGTLNFAPRAADSALVFYEARALQQDWTRVSGNLVSDPLTISYTMKHVAKHAVQTSLGTSGIPVNYTYPMMYRDFVATINDPYLMYIDSFEFSLPGGMEYSFLGRYADPSELPNLTFKEKAPYSYSGYSSNSRHVLAFPKVGDLVSAVSRSTDKLTLQGNLIAAYWDPNALIAPNGAQVSPPRCDEYGNGYNFVGAIGDKNKELFMPAAYSYGFGGLISMGGMFNLVGRPILR